VTTVDLAGDAERVTTVELLLPDRPDVRWFALAVPIPLADLEDRGITARQVALNAACGARETAEPAVYDAVLAYRAEPGRGAA